MFVGRTLRYWDTNFEEHIIEICLEIYYYHPWLKQICRLPKLKVEWGQRSIKQDAMPVFQHLQSHTVGLRFTRGAEKSVYHEKS